MDRELGDFTLNELKEICINQFDIHNSCYQCEKCPLQYHCSNTLSNLMDYYLNDIIKNKEGN